MDRDEGMDRDHAIWSDDWGLVRLSPSCRSDLPSPLLNKVICEKTIHYIVNEYKDKNDEAEASARLYYETNPRHSLPALRCVNSV